MSTINLILITDAEWEVCVQFGQMISNLIRSFPYCKRKRVDWTQSYQNDLGRLVGKGVLNTEEGRKFIYTANIEEKEAVDAEDIFKRICNKNVGNVIGSIIEDHV